MISVRFELPLRLKGVSKPRATSDTARAAGSEPLPVFPLVTTSIPTERMIKFLFPEIKCLLERVFCLQVNCANWSQTT